MAVIGRFDNGMLLVEETVAGPASYATASKPTIVFNDLQQGVEAVLGIFADDARIMQQASLAGRTLTYVPFGMDAAGASDGDPFIEVTDTTDLSSSNYRAIAYGR